MIDSECGSPRRNLSLADTHFKLESLHLKKDDDLAIPKELQGAMECGVCLNLCERPVQLSCGHTFCESCVNQLVAMRAEGADRGGFAHQLFDMFMRERNGNHDEDNNEIRLGNNERGGGGGMQQVLMDPRMQQGAGMGAVAAAPQQAMGHAQMDAHQRMMMGFGGFIGGQPAVPPPRMAMGGMYMGPMGHMMGHPHMNGAPPGGVPMQGRQQIQRAPIRIDQQQQQAQHAYIGGLRMGQPMQQPQMGGVRYGGYGGRQETVNCPECRSPTTIPPNGLPVNYKVQDLIERVKARSKVIEPIGNMCQSCSTNINSSIYFSCLNEECRVTAQTLCSMCGLRNHNGHNVVENKTLSHDKVEEERRKIIVLTRNAEGYKSSFSRLREEILMSTEHCEDMLANVIKELEILDAELDRPERFTQRDVDLRVNKASRLVKALEKFVNQMHMTKTHVGETVATHIDALITRMGDIVQSNTMIEDSEQEEGEENEVARDADLYRLNQISADVKAKLNAFKSRRSLNLQKKREESKKLKSMNMEKKNESDESRLSAQKGQNGQKGQRMGTRDIKLEPIDQYEIYSNLNQINLRDESGETRGVPATYNHPILKRRRISPSSTGAVSSSSTGRSGDRGEEQPCSSRSMATLNVHSSLHNPLSYSQSSLLVPPPVPQPPMDRDIMADPLGEEQQANALDGLVMEGMEGRVVEGIINNDDVLDVLEDGRIIRPEDIEGIAEDGRYVVRRPLNVLQVMQDGGEDEDEVEY